MSLEFAKQVLRDKIRELIIERRIWKDNENLIKTIDGEIESLNNALVLLNTD
jgi:hypothetical protein